MASLILYGSTVANSTLVNACDMANASGGVETSVTTAFTGVNNYGEIQSQGGTMATVTAIPATPTGNGWVYEPGDGIFTADNWSASLTTSSLVGANTMTLRFFRYSGGVYTSIGQIVLTSGLFAAKSTYLFPATAMPAMTFVTGDLLYIDLWWYDSGGASGDNPAIYLSTSSTAGVSADMQVTTSYFPGPGDPVLYGSAVADSILTTACLMVANSGGVATSTSTTVTSSTQAFCEVYSKGFATALALAAIPVPTGNGWVYYPGAGNFAAGPWSALIALSAANTLSLSFTLRFYKLSGGVYTSIGSIALSAQAISSTRSVFTFPATSMSAVTFAAGDALYVDLWFNDATGANGDVVTVYESTTSTAGVANNMQVATALFTPQAFAPTRESRPRWIMRPLMGGIFTPFQAIPAWVQRAITAPFIRPTLPVNIPHYVRRSLTSILINYGLDIQTRLRLRSADQLKDIASRLKLAKFVDIAARLRLVASQIKDVSTRLRLRSADQLKDITARLRIRSADQLKDVKTRVRLRSADQLRDIALRLRLRSADQLKDVIGRLRLAKFVDIASRLRLRSADKLSDITSRLRLRSADQLRDISSRLRVRSADQLKDVKARLRLRSADQLKDIATRLVLAAAQQRLKDIASRLRLRSANQLKDIQARLKLAKFVDIATRLRLRSANKLSDITTRVRLKSADKLSDIASRVRLRSADQARDIVSRLKLRSPNQLRDIVARVRLMSASRLLDITSRVRLRSADQLRDVSTRFRQMSVAQRKDVASRVRVMSAAQLRDIASRLRQISQPQPRDIRGRLVLVIFAVTHKDITCRLILVEFHVSHITVESARGMVTTHGARGKLTTMGAQGELEVTGSRGTLTSTGSRGTVTVEEE